MKIRIKKLPEMKTGGVFNYMPYAGLLSTNPFGLIQSNTKNLDKSYNDTIKAIEKDKANLEAEHGEVLFKFDAGGIFKIMGKSHAKGGTPLKADPGDFIFSNDKSLAITEKEAEIFNLSYSSKGQHLNTPAKILKKEIDTRLYNKYMVTLNDPNADLLAKTTAQLMLGKYMEKIGQLGYLQESKKDFPQGLPQFAQGTAPVHSNDIVDAQDKALMFAKYGGVFKKFDEGGLNYVDDESKCPCGGVYPNCTPCTQAQLDALAKKAVKGKKEDVVGMTKQGRSGNADIYHSGTDPNLKTINVPLGKPGGNINERWKRKIQGFIDQGATLDQLVTQKHGTKEGLEKMFKFPVLTPGTDKIIAVEDQATPAPGYNPTPTMLNPPTGALPPNSLNPVPEVPFQGFNIGMNAQEVLSGIMPYLTAASQPTYYDMLTQKYSPNIRLDRLNNTQERSDIKQSSGIAQRELLGAGVSALALSDVAGNEARNIQQSNARVDSGNTQIANQESMVNYQADQQDNMFNLGQVHQTYNNNILSRQRRNEMLANGTNQSIGNFLAIQNNLDTINQQATAAVLPFLSSVDSVDENGNPIKVQVPPITFNERRMPIPTGFGSLDSVGVKNAAATPTSDDYKAAYEYFLGKGVTPDKAAQAATIIFYGKNGQKGAAGIQPNNPYASMMSSLYNFQR